MSHLDNEAQLRALVGDATLPTDSAEFALAVDKADVLSNFRQLFHFPPPNEDGDQVSYFVGNSLGLQHKDVAPSVSAYMDKWRSQASEGWTQSPNPWLLVDELLRDDVATIVGAQREEVMVMNTLTANLHLLLLAFYHPTGAGRRKILCEKSPFPSDMHALVSQVEHHEFNPDTDLVEISEPEREGLHYISTERIIAALEEHRDSAAILVLSAIHFLTGQLFDIASITAAAHERGILVLIDAAHAAGNVPLHFHDWGVDCAVWCNYKYLNGGPGALGGAFVHSKHLTGSGDQPAAVQRCLKGWWGQATPERVAAVGRDGKLDGISEMLLSPPTPLAVCSIAPSLKLSASIGMAKQREKSLLLTGYLEWLVDTKLQGRLEILTPRNPAERGAQLSLRILPGKLRSEQVEGGIFECGAGSTSPAALLQKQLLKRRIFADNRPPDILRVAPHPLYCSFHDVHRLVTALTALFI